MPNSSARTALLFVGVLAVALIIQMTFWLTFPIADQNFWVTDVTKVAAGQHSPSDVTYMYPATTVKYPMAALVHYGVEPKIAIRLVMALVCALLIALAAFLAYLLWPQHLLWLALGALLVPDLRLLHVNPAAATASLLMVVLVFLYIYAHKRRAEKSLTPLIALGVCAGLLLATRIDTGVFVLLTTTPFLFFMFRFRALAPLLCAAATFAACDPHLIAHPLAYLQSILDQIARGNALEGRKIFVEFLVTYPFAIISIFTSMLVAYRVRMKGGDMPLPVNVYAWLLGATLLFTAMLAPLSYHPTRYFMPLYLVWDVLLLLWLTVLARPYLPLHWLPSLTERRFEWAVIGLIILIGSIRLTLFLLADTREVLL